MKRRILISAGQSNAGKTTITLGIIGALIRRGLKVASTKIGPDYIDPMYHRAIGATGYNLDRFLMEDRYIKQLLFNIESQYDIVIMEGAMGYYDGIGIGSDASSCDMSVFTNTPSILIFSGKGKGASLAAEIGGFLKYGEHRIAGVILNETKPMMAPYYRQIIETYTGLPLLGCIPQLNLQLDSRHLGLLNPEEILDFSTYNEAIVDAMEKYVDIDQLLEISKVSSTPKSSLERTKIAPTKVAIAYDEAFNFYYRDVLEDFERAGVEWVYFSPLKETIPKGISGVYLGGGYPELFSEQIGRNKQLQADLAEVIRQKGVLLAECGGYMSLCSSIDGQAVLGLLPGDIEMAARLQNFGYHFMTAREDGLLLKVGETVPVHEFHYGKSDIEADCFEFKKVGREQSHRGAFHDANVYAGFAHLHFSGTTLLRHRILKALEEARPWQGSSF